MSLLGHLIYVFCQCKWDMSLNLSGVWNTFWFPIQQNIFCSIWVDEVIEIILVELGCLQILFEHDKCILNKMNYINLKVSAWNNSPNQTKNKIKIFWTTHSKMLAWNQTEFPFWWYMTSGAELPPRDQLLQKHLETRTVWLPVL